MKKLKLYDMWISIVLIIGFAVASFINQDQTFIIGYFVVGGWQVISMLVHVFRKTFTAAGEARHVYHRVTFVSLVTFPLGSFWILLFTAPFMAIYYTWLCYTEVRRMNQRPLALLK